MAELLTIRSAEQYFKEFGRDGIGKGADRWMIRRQLIDAFHKEVFGLVATRAKKNFNDIPPEGDPETKRIIKNVCHDTQMKWKKLCAMFEMYAETKVLLNIDDLAMTDDDIMRGAADLA